LRDLLASQGGLTVENQDFLVLKNISKSYAGVRALDSVDLTIRRGEIHCMVGENGSGKSTLIKIISGFVRPDSGQILFEGVLLGREGSLDSIKRGIEVIYQDMSLFPNLTVAENIAVNQRVEAGEKLIRWKAFKEIARQGIDKIGLDVDLDSVVGGLSIATQQLIAICRALTKDVKLLVMDEPTSALTTIEIDKLFKVVTDLQARGISILFVSHKLTEVFQVAQRVSVLRDGRSVGTFDRKDLDQDQLSFLMTGRKIEKNPVVVATTETTPLLEVKSLSRANEFSDVNITLRRGETIGITGLLGSGRTEIALSVFGLTRADSGEVRVDGKPVKINSVVDAIRAGIGYVPENRLVQGLVMQQSVADNLVMIGIKKLVNRFGILSKKKRQVFVEDWIRKLVVKVSDQRTAVHTLSGGNQQKVVIAKWLAIQPRILILDNPTAGIDIAAKSNIHGMIRNLAANGMGIIVISDEIREVLDNCSRVLLMKGGRIVADYPCQSVSEQAIQAMMEMK
jgi:simple sugar transport system ATP-binding protein